MRWCPGVNRNTISVSLGKHSGNISHPFPRHTLLSQDQSQVLGQVLCSFSNFSLKFLAIFCVSQASVNSLSVLPQSHAGNQGICPIKGTLRTRQIKMTRACSQIVHFQGHLTPFCFSESISDFCGVGLVVPVEHPIYSRTSYIHTNPVLPRGSPPLSWAWCGTHECKVLPSTAGKTRGGKNLHCLT